MNQPQDKQKRPSRLSRFFRVFIKMAIIRVAMIALDVTGTTGLIGQMIISAVNMLEYAAQPVLEDIHLAVGEGQTAAGVINYVTARMHPAIKIHDIIPHEDHVTFRVLEGKAGWAKRYMQ